MKDPTGTKILKLDKAYEIVVLLEAKRKELMNCKEATAAYWNGDGWGSISGHKDAQLWVNRELASYLVKLTSNA